MIKEDINTNDLFIPIGIDHEFLTFFPSYNLTSFDNYRKIESYIKQNNFSNDSELFRNLFESDFLTNFIASFSSDCSFNCKTRINFIINISDESIINSNMEKQINVFIKNNSQVNFYLFVNTKDQLNDNFIKFKIYNITVYKYRYDINKTIYFSLILNIKKNSYRKKF